tara:strand:- start:1335 stop:1517 length:183 start_codon:yes stop_codon:yes gene_type:complete
MPFKKEPFDAVNIIVKGLRKENGHIAFPASLYFLIIILSIILPSIITIASSRIQKKYRPH